MICDENLKYVTFIQNLVQTESIRSARVNLAAVHTSSNFFVNMVVEF